MKKTLTKTIKFWLIPAVIGILVTVFLRSNYASLYRVEGNQMYPTISNNQMILVQPISPTNVSRGTIVAYKTNSKLRQNSDIKKLTGRIIGLPGDKVSFVDNKLMVNGRTVRDWYIEKNVLSATGLGINTGWTLQTLSTNLNWPKSDRNSQTVAKNSYFILNDNRENTIDSRTYGYVKDTNLIGVAKSAFWDMNKYSNRINDGANRFFK
ncbi:MAG: signal peptidase I [Lactobacillaceae bacterium]|jgi:signal peptidase I|nr:signal peptidase I [Lactobacillaceae bacterium]